MITKSFFHFLITINMENVIVETGMPCQYKRESCDVFAKTHQSILADYLRRHKAGKDVYNYLVNYHAQKQWAITEV